MMLTNFPGSGWVNEIAENIFQPDILAAHEYLDSCRRKSHLEPERISCSLCWRMPFVVIRHTRLPSRGGFFAGRREMDLETTGIGLSPSEIFA